MNERQADWDRMLVSSFWGCFTSKRRRWAWRLVKSFELLHGEGAGEGLARFPRGPHQLNQDISRFVCGYLKPLADRLIDIGELDGETREAIVRWLSRRPTLTCSYYKGDHMEHKEVRRAKLEYFGSQIVGVGITNHHDAQSRLGGKSCGRIVYRNRA